MNSDILQLIYLIGSVSFMLGLKMLSKPDTARKGNLVAAFGMTIAIFGTIFLYENGEGEGLHNFGWIFGGLVIGSVLGTLSAKRVKMTQMPEMVSLFNGMGGACAMLISAVEFTHMSHESSVEAMPQGELLIILLGLIIGSVSFAGSMVAWGKLSGKVGDKSLKLQQLVNIGLLVLILE
jgi:NAD(P) transhydrogenase subunit beta